MIARCAKCQNTFSTERFGSQFCPNCGAEIFLRDPNAPAPPPAGSPAAGPAGVGSGAASGPSNGTGTAAEPPSSTGTTEGTAGTPDGAWAPWEDRRGLTLTGAFVETWKQSVLNPSKFFSRLRGDEARGAYSYGLALWFIGSLASAMWNALQSLAFGPSKLSKLLPDLGGDRAELLKRLEQLQSPRWAITSVAMSPVSAVIGFLIVVAVLHLMVVLFCQGGKGWNATVRAVGYSSGPLALSLIPACGGFIGQLWAMVLTIVAITHLHKTTGGRAAAAVLVPIVLLFCCLCIGVVMMIAGIGAMGAALGSGQSL